jgi:hypothetical protein
MDYCGPLGLPHSQFKSWDPLDQAKALAWQKRQSEIHSCGVHPDVWDPERGGDPGGLRLVSKVCGACELAEMGREVYQKQRAAGEYQVWQFGPGLDDDVREGEPGL